MPSEETPRGPRGLRQIVVQDLGRLYRLRWEVCGGPWRSGAPPWGFRYFKASSAVRISALLGRCLKSSSTLAQTTLPVLSIM
jgi:hypothetical protein